MKCQREIDGSNRIAFSSISEPQAFIEAFSSLPQNLPSQEGRRQQPSAWWKMFFSPDLVMKREFWLAFDGNKPVARIGANVMMHTPNTGAIGFLDFDKEHINAAVELLSLAKNWLRQHDVTEAFAPLNLSTWFDYRYLEEPAELKPFSWEPTLPQAHIEFLLSHGFVHSTAYRTRAVVLDEQLARPQFQKARATLTNLEKQGWKFSRIDKDLHILKDVQRLHNLSLEGFENNYLYDPISFSIFQTMYLPLANYIDWSPSRIIIDPAGIDVGFLFAFYDGEYVVMKSTAILPSARGQGLSSLLHWLALDEALSSGYRKAITALVIDGNISESWERHQESVGQHLWQHRYSLLKTSLF